MSGLGPVVLLPGYARRYVSARGGCVDVHETHGKLELRQNLPVAVFLADRGEAVQLLAVSRVPGSTSADATRNGVEWEFKSLESSSANAVDTALRNASKQANRVLLAVPPDIRPALLEQAMFDRLRRSLNLQEVAILKSGELYHFTRNEVMQNAFRGRMG